jgi:hypothetical protein
MFVTRLATGRQPAIQAFVATTTESASIEPWSLLTRIGDLLKARSAVRS